MFSESWFVKQHKAFPNDFKHLVKNTLPTKILRLLSIKIGNVLRMKKSKHDLIFLIIRAFSPKYEKVHRDH